MQMLKIIFQHVVRSVAIHYNLLMQLIILNVHQILNQCFPPIDDIHRDLNWRIKCKKIKRRHCRPALHIRVAASENLKAADRSTADTYVRMYMTGNDEIKKIIMIMMIINLINKLSLSQFVFRRGREGGKGEGEGDLLCAATLLISPCFSNDRVSANLFSSFVVRRL